MKKNDLQDLVKSGKAGMMTKVKELKLTIIDLKLKSARGEAKNLRERKNMKRTIAQLMTHVALIKETK